MTPPMNRETIPRNEDWHKMPGPLGVFIHPDVRGVNPEDIMPPYSPTFSDVRNLYLTFIAVSVIGIGGLAYKASDLLPSDGSKDKQTSIIDDLSSHIRTAELEIDRAIWNTIFRQ